jgi:hypothetical protein
MTGHEEVDEVADLGALGVRQPGEAGVRRPAEPESASSSASLEGSIPQRASRSSTNGIPVASDARSRSAGVGRPRRPGRIEGCATHPR